MNPYEAEKVGKFRHEDLLREGKQERLANKARPEETKQVLRKVKTLLAFFL